MRKVQKICYLTLWGNPLHYDKREIWNIFLLWNASMRARNSSFFNLICIKRVIKVDFVGNTVLLPSSFLSVFFTLLCSPKREKGKAHFQKVLCVVYFFLLYDRTFLSIMSSQKHQMSEKKVCLPYTWLLNLSKNIQIEGLIRLPWTEKYHSLLNRTSLSINKNDLVGYWFLQIFSGELCCAQFLSNC